MHLHHVIVPFHYVRNHAAELHQLNMTMTGNLHQLRNMLYASFHLMQDSMVETSTDL